MASPMVPGLATPSEAAEEIIAPTVVYMLYGRLDPPWHDKKVAKQRMKNKIAALSSQLASQLVLKKGAYPEQWPWATTFLSACA